MWFFLIDSTKLAQRLHERWAIPGGNVLGGRKLGAAAPLFPGGCAELSGECERGTPGACATIILGSSKWVVGIYSLVNGAYSIKCLIGYWGLFDEVSC